MTAVSCCIPCSYNIDIKLIPIFLVMRLRYPFFGKGTMKSVIHWSGGLCDLDIYFNTTSVYDVGHHLAAPLRASAVITQSRPERLLLFMYWIVFCVSPSVGESIQKGRSWSAGGGRSDGSDPLSLLSKSAKYCPHRASSSVSLDGGEPSRLFTFGVDIFWPEFFLMIFQVLLSSFLSASCRSSICCCIEANSSYL